MISAKTKIEDAEYLKDLMNKGKRQKKLRGVFIEAGLHLSTSPKTLILVLNNQNYFLNDCSIVPALFIKEEVINRWVEVDG